VTLVVGSTSNNPHPTHCHLYCRPRSGATGRPFDRDARSWFDGRHPLLTRHTASSSSSSRVVARTDLGPRTSERSVRLSSGMNMRIRPSSER
jgi:hypothetical protein